ncbi:MAG TPA: hypothetical protein VM370_00055 [Candidatus Thermoplasmatota archaeon]|nr:hypothetical protein [Candidatus Thermoplasmatota archaeon]
MKTTTLFVVAAAFLMPFVAADPNVQTGEQTGSFWSESAIVPAQGGTTFLLAGAVGDHDIIFYDASFNLVGFFLACGPDTGTVPGNGAWAEIMVYDHIGGAVPQCLAPADPLPSSTFVYVDGL